MGFVAGELKGPRGIAANAAHIAVTAWCKGPRYGTATDHVLVLFDTTTRTPLWTLSLAWTWEGRRVEDYAVTMRGPYGLRLSRDGNHVVVADSAVGDVGVFSTKDAEQTGVLAAGLDCPTDVEEVEGGWLIACGTPVSIMFVSGSAALAATRQSLSESGSPAADARGSQAELIIAPVVDTAGAHLGHGSGPAAALDLEDDGSVSHGAVCAPELVAALPTSMTRSKAVFHLVGEGDAAFSFPRAMCVDPGGAMYVAMSEDMEVRVCASAYSG